MTLWDQNIANAEKIYDACMKMGAVILKPAGKQRPGFAAPSQPAEPPKQESTS